MPQVTVLMSVYNAEKYVRKTIESVLNQTFSDFEFIIINDGSTDKTLPLIKSIHDSRIHLLNHKTSQGLTKSLNEGIKAAKGQYIARIDADDNAHPQRLTKQVKYLETHKSVGVVGSWYQIINEYGTIIASNELETENQLLKERLWQSNHLLHSSVMIRKSCLDKVGLYREEFKYAQDYDLWLRIAEVYKIANIPEYLTQWRLHLSSISAQKRAVQYRYADYAKLLSKQRRNQLSDELELLKKESSKTKLQAKIVSIESVSKSEVSAALNQWAMSLCIYNQYESAVTVLKQSLKINRLHIRSWYLLAVASLLTLLPLSVGEHIKLIRRRFISFNSG